MHSVKEQQRRLYVGFIAANQLSSEVHADPVLICTDATGPEEKNEEQNQERAGEELGYDRTRGKCRLGYLDP